MYSIIMMMHATLMEYGNQLPWSQNCYLYMYYLALWYPSTDVNYVLIGYPCHVSWSIFIFNTLDTEEVQATYETEKAVLSKDETYTQVIVS